MKIMYFDSFEEYSNCEPAKEYETVAIIREGGWIKADVCTECKRGGTALNRFFKAVANIPELADWAECVKESVSNGYYKDSNRGMADSTVNTDYSYAWSLEDYDGVWYFFLNVKVEEAQESQEATESESVQEAQGKPAQEAQEAQRIEIDGNATFPAPHTFWSNSPRLILNPDAIPEPIDTARNPHIAMMLRYQAEELMSSVFSDWYDDILSRDEIENDAFFTDNSLNLNNGDGYQIAENLFIDHIFAISLYDSPRGVVAVYDSDCDDFSYWLIY